MSRATDTYERLRGPIVPINVCFNPDGTIHHHAVTAYVDWLCEERVPILLLTFGSSEFVGLSDAEIWELTATVAAAIKGRALFIASTGLWKPAITKTFLQHADDIGADAVKVQISTFLPLKRDVAVRYYDQIQGGSDIPLLLWASGAVKLPVPVAAELAQREQIIGMKNDGDQFYDYYDYIRATEGCNFAVVSGGQMRNFVFGHQVGSPAYLCPIAPFRPDIAMAFYAQVAAQDYDAAWQTVAQYEDPWLQWAITQDWIPLIKATIQLQGLYPNNLPASPMPPPPSSVLDDVRAKLVEVFGASRTRP